MSSDILPIGPVDPAALGTHQRVSMKRAPCAICKQAAKEERRGIKRQKRHALQALSPNIASKRQDRHVARAMTGCSSCNVSLYSTRGCWDAFHWARSGGLSCLVSIGPPLRSKGIGISRATVESFVERNPSDCRGFEEQNQEARFQRALSPKPSILNDAWH